MFYIFLIFFYILFKLLQFLLLSFYLFISLKLGWIDIIYVTIYIFHLQCTIRIDSNHLCFLKITKFFIYRINLFFCFFLRSVKGDVTIRCSHLPPIISNLINSSFLSCRNLIFSTLFKCFFNTSFICKLRTFFYNNLFFFFIFFLRNSTRTKLLSLVHEFVKSFLTCKVVV